MQQEYQPELATLELIVEVRRLLATERRVERLICRYLADLADRLRLRLDTALWVYADELHAARCIFGLGVRDTRERVRVGRALRRLPRVEAAFINGEVSYSRVRELTRVAEPSTEDEWLELARTLDMRALERRVAAALRRAVMLRDRSRCRVPGCNRRRYVDVHHIVAQNSGGEHSRSNCLVLCTTHHHLLHDGKLELTGDAEGELCFRDADGRPLVRHDLEGDGLEGRTPGLAELGTGTDSRDTDNPTPTQGGAPSHGPTERLLHAIGRRGGWSLDALIDKLGLPANVVAAALTQLELCGAIRYRDFAYEPI